MYTYNFLLQNGGLCNNCLMYCGICVNRCKVLEQLRRGLKLSYHIFLDEFGKLYSSHGLMKCTDSDWWQLRRMLMGQKPIHYATVPMFVKSKIRGRVWNKEMYQNVFYFNSN